MTFRPPYKFRLMTLILGHEIELVRFRRQIFNSDEHFWTDGLTTPWWWERSMPERECITPRPDIRPLRKTIPVAKLKPEENEALEAAGLKPSFKT